MRRSSAAQASTRAGGRGGPVSRTPASASTTRGRRRGGALYVPRGCGAGRRLAPAGCRPRWPAPAVPRRLWRPAPAATPVVAGGRRAVPPRGGRRTARGGLPTLAAWFSAPPGRPGEHRRATGDRCPPRWTWSRVPHRPESRPTSPVTPTPPRRRPHRAGAAHVTVEVTGQRARARPRGRRVRQRHRGDARTGLGRHAWWLPAPLAKRLPRVTLEATRATEVTGGPGAQVVAVSGGRGLPWKTLAACQGPMAGGDGPDGPKLGPGQRPARRARWRGRAGGGAVSDEALRDEHRLLVPDAEDALVEELVVQRAQAQTVVDVVRTVERPPAHVRGLQRGRHRPGSGRRSRRTRTASTRTPSAPVRIRRSRCRRIGDDGGDRAASVAEPPACNSSWSEGGKCWSSSTPRHPSEESDGERRNGETRSSAPAARRPRRPQLTHATAGMLPGPRSVRTAHTPSPTRWWKGYAGVVPCGGPGLGQQSRQVLLHRAVKQLRAGVLLVPCRARQEEGAACAGTCPAPLHCPQPARSSESMTGDLARLTAETPRGWRRRGGRPDAGYEGRGHARGRRASARQCVPSGALSSPATPGRSSASGPGTRRGTGRV